MRQDVAMVRGDELGGGGAVFGRGQVGAPGELRQVAHLNASAVVPSSAAPPRGRRGGPAGPDRRRNPATGRRSTVWTMPRAVRSLLPGIRPGREVEGADTQHGFSSPR